MLIASLLPALSACRAPVSARPAAPSEREMMRAARDVGAWLRSTHRETADGPLWPDDALRPGVQSMSVSSGVAGQVVFFSELYRATGDSADLRASRQGADMLLRALSGADSAALARETTLYGGVAGVGVALRAAHLATRDRRYADAHRAIAGDLARRARGAGPAAWSDANDIMFGDAGTGLFLLEAGRELGDTALVATGVAVARTLVQRAMPERGGLTWYRGASSRFVLPNFSHGAAGIGMFLARAGHASGDVTLDSAAVLAARYLVAIGRRDSLGFRVPYGWPEPPGGWARPFDIGWAHGPAGTARVFWQLWQATGDSSYLRLVLDCAQAVRSAGLFGSAGSEYGRASFGLNMRFDLAGVADFLADLYAVTGDRAHLRLARAIADTVFARADRADGALRWVAPRYGFMGDAGQPGALTGYLHGAAGYGLLFLKIHALERGRPPPRPFPDNPFDG
jgi:lantibiotic modifying enzyme